MIVELLGFMADCWPKLLAGGWFALFNIVLKSAFSDKQKYKIVRFVGLFLVSSAFLSIVGEFYIHKIYSFIIGNTSVTDEYSLLLICLNIFGDGLMVFLGGVCYTYINDMKNYLGATLYLEFVCIERLCLVLAVDPLSYLVIMVVVQLIFYLAQRKYLPYFFNNSPIDWKRIYIYLVGLFLVLDLLYGAFYIFPELATNAVDMQNLFWLDAMALINTGFVVGYLKINIAAAKEQEEKDSYFKKLQSSQEDIIASLAEISEAKSGETGQHVRRVAEYSRIVAERLNLSKYEVATIRISAMMHDLGKLMIRKEVLEKPGRLSPEEFEEMKKHTQYGWELLANSEGDIIDMARVIALQHHERWDGKGYPAGLKGNEISIYAQIVAVTDVYDALTSVRSYKAAWTPVIALGEILNQRGKHFSPAVVDAFVICFNEIEAIRVEYSDIDAKEIMGHDKKNEKLLSS